MYCLCTITSLLIVSRDGIHEYKIHVNILVEQKSHKKQASQNWTNKESMWFTLHAYWTERGPGALHIVQSLVFL